MTLKSIISFSLLFLIVFSESIFSADFVWKKEVNFLDPEEPIRSYSINDGRWLISGSESTRKQGEQLLETLQSIRALINRKYGLDQSSKQIQIKLLDDQTYFTENAILHWNTNSAAVVLPFRIKNESEFQVSEFSFAQLLEAIVKVDLIYGSSTRYPISRQAKRFVDGLSGFLTISSLESLYLLNREELLQQFELSEKFSELLSKFSHRGKIDDYEDNFYDFSKFLEGIQVEEKKSKTIAIFESDLARLFFDLSQKDPEVVSKIISLLGKDTNDWYFKGENCNPGKCDTFIDYTKANYIFNKVVGSSLTEKLEAIQTLKEEDRLVKNQNEIINRLPVSTNYEIEYQIQEGDNQPYFEFHYRYSNQSIDSRQVAKDEKLFVHQGILNFGVLDESNQTQVTISYASGSKEEKQSQNISGTNYNISESTEKDELRLGASFEDLNVLDDSLRRYGFYYNYSRLRKRWDLSEVSGINKENEFIHRSYHLIEMQNSWFSKITREFDIGIDSSMYLGIVNHSASTGLIESSKLNEDTGSFVLGGQLIPEVRYRSFHNNFGLNLQVGYQYIWQPFNNDAANDNHSSSINATQVTEWFAVGFDLIF